MGDNSNIEWTKHTFNPWWGCSRVSPGCRFCYADTLATRWGQGDLWLRHGPRRITSDANWKKPLKWNRDAAAAGESAMVFCASMADVFEQHPVSEVNATLDAARARLWDLIEATPWLRWQLLTKRPQNVATMTRWGDRWPGHVWLGTSVEDQRRADERIPVLLSVPAKVRFLSCEPLLGPVDLLGPRLIRPARCSQCGEGWDDWACGPTHALLAHDRGIGWVIAGGESGSKARPMNPDWVRTLRDQCVGTNLPYLFKQWGGRTPKAGGRELDGRTWDEFPRFDMTEARSA